MSRRWGWWLLLFASCGAPLPSTTPLGEGPLVAVEAKRRAKEEEALRDKRASSDAGARPASSSEKSASATPPPAGEPDAAAAEADGGTQPSTADAGSSKPATGPLVLAGLYVGHDESIFRLSGMPERNEKDPNAKTRVVDKPDGSLDLIAIDSSNGKDICTLHATPNGKDRKSFTVTAGQHCFESGAGMSATLTKGSAKLDSGKLTLDLFFDLEVGNQDFQLSGTLEYHFEGDKN